MMEEAAETDLLEIFTQAGSKGVDPRHRPLLPKPVKTGTMGQLILRDLIACSFGAKNVCFGANLIRHLNVTPRHWIYCSHYNITIVL